MRDEAEHKAAGEAVEVGADGREPGVTVPDCIFCKIHRGELPATVVSRTEGLLAIEDINPKADVHLLVIPERHIETFRDIGELSADEGKRMLDFVADTAKVAGLDEYRLMVFCGAGAGQTVFHLHWHVLGGRFRGMPAMSLIARLEDELTAAMKERNTARRDALRLILSSLRSAEKELQRPLHEDEELQVLQRERKRRVESIEAFQSAGRDEQAAKEQAELEVLEEFMPEPLTEDELERIVDDAIAEVGATSMRELGRVMADVMPQIAGRADGSAVSQLVREKLA